MIKIHIRTSALLFGSPWDLILGNVNCHPCSHCFSYSRDSTTGTPSVDKAPAASCVFTTLSVNLPSAPVQELTGPTSPQGRSVAESGTPSPIRSIWTVLPKAKSPANRLRLDSAQGPSWDLDTQEGPGFQRNPACQCRAGAELF